jgi:acetylcholinesterase
VLIAECYRCPGNNSGILSGSEDCLTVNIFRQKNKRSHKKVPVAVYIPGGAFNRGSCKFMLFTPPVCYKSNILLAKSHNTSSMVAWSEKPFIGVSFNYR